MAYSKAFLLLSFLFLFSLLISSEVSARQITDQTRNHEEGLPEAFVSGSQPKTDRSKNPNAPMCGKGKGLIGCTHPGNDHSKNPGHGGHHPGHPH